MLDRWDDLMSDRSAVRRLSWSALLNTPQMVPYNSFICVSLFLSSELAAVDVADFGL